MIQNIKFIIGTSHFGASINYKNSEKFLKTAYDIGIRYIDTAPMYGNYKSEKIIGQIIKKNNLPFKIFTKVGLEGKKINNFFYSKKINLTEKNIINSVDRSLKNLGCKKIDLLQLHFFDNQTDIKKTMSAVTSLMKSGKVNNYGICNYNYLELTKLIKFIKKYNLPKPFSCQVHYNLIERRAEKYILPYLKKHKINIFANRVFSMGILSGQYKSKSNFPKKSRAKKSLRISKLINRDIIQISNDLNTFAKYKKLETIDLSINWLKKNKMINKIIFGISDIDQLKNLTKIKRLGKYDLNQLNRILMKYNNIIKNKPNKFLIL